jgi:hypothetical protein
MKIYLFYVPAQDFLMFSPFRRKRTNKCYMYGIREPFFTGYYIGEL